MHALDSALENLKREFDAACAKNIAAARTQITHELNQFLRRLRQYKSEREWASAVVDGATAVTHDVGLFSVLDGTLSLRGQSNLNIPDDLSFPMSAARAFDNAVRSADPVVALRKPGEVSPALASSDIEDRAYLYPISNSTRVVAVLFAAGRDHVDGDALELITGIASAVLERHSNTSLHTQITPALAPAASASSAPTRPAAEPKPHAAWSKLTELDRDTHMRAQRFARVTVAEMELAKPDASRAGRAENNLYVFLKSEIDTARQRFREHFMTTPSMVDYLHVELVRVAAEGDESKLGVEYPGPLV